MVEIIMWLTDSRGDIDKIQQAPEADPGGKKIGTTTTTTTKTMDDSIHSFWLMVSTSKVHSLLVFSLVQGTDNNSSEDLIFLLCVSAVVSCKEYCALIQEKQHTTEIWIMQHDCQRSLKKSCLKDIRRTNPWEAVSHKVLRKSHTDWRTDEQICQVFKTKSHNVGNKLNFFQV